MKVCFFRYKLDDIRLTGISKSDTALRILGGGVADRMGINFFDVDNNSVRAYSSQMFNPRRSNLMI
jgi:hypothetical protein